MCERATAKGIALVAAQVLPVMAIVSLFPAIPKLFQQFGGVPDAPFLIPMILTLPSLVVALLSPLAGSLADRFGRRPIFVGALAIYVVAGLAPLVLDDLAAIIASRCLLGAAEGAIVTVSGALIGDYFGEQRFRWVSWVGVVISICGALLVAVGGALADMSWRGPFAIYALAAPVFVLAWFVIDEPLRPARDGAGHGSLPFPWREAGIIGAVTFVTSILYYVEPLHVATMLTARGVRTATTIGLIQGATSVAYIGGSLLYRRLHHWPVGRHLGLAGGLIGAGLVVIALSVDAALATVGAAVQQFGSGLVIPALMAWGQSRLPVEQRGRGMGIWAMAFFLGLFLCPPFVTLLSGGPQGLSTTVLALGAVTIVLAALAPRLLRAAGAPLPSN
jgi:MFS family permease